MPAGQQVALQPALADVLGEDLQHPPGPGLVLVGGQQLPLELPVGHLEDRLQPVGRHLVRPDQPEGRPGWPR